MEKELIEAAVKDAKSLEAKGIAALGISDALFINGKQVRTGPPPSYEKIKKLIGKRERKLKL